MAPPQLRTKQQAGRLAAELATLGRATPGRRNHTLNRSAFKVYRYVAEGLLDDQEVTAAFTQAALAIGLQPAEVARTLASARTAGLANPRSLPALLPTEATQLRLERALGGLTAVVVGAVTALAFAQSFHALRTFAEAQRIVPAGWGWVFAATIDGFVLAALLTSLSLSLQGDRGAAR
jgi:predicted trehalose synthase